MSLTEDDLEAIKELIDGSQKRTIDRINKLDDALSIQMANGLAEVHEKIDTVQADLETMKTDLGTVKTDLEAVKNTAERIERQQRAEIERVDTLELKTARLKQKLKMA